ncbi:MAG: cell filamentation protein Fic [Rickettsiales bacterium]|nr:cell filamentation protein Fic [Rickettsiales bacterium]
MSVDFKVPEPKWNSPLATLVLDLERLRSKHFVTQVPPYIFLQLKNIFQALENLGSARIEGNNTTLSEYVEKIIEDRTDLDESDQELNNLNEAISFIEENTDRDTVIDRAYISNLHKVVTQKLTPPPSGEGSETPGQLRKKNVKIAQSAHKPPAGGVPLESIFDEFIQFINQPLSEQNQLLMVAVAHHIFMYVHPFDNGNGRTGRLLNYALLIKLGFNVQVGGRILNPSSVFYTDRDKYYEMLGLADAFDDNSALAWCEYFLNGLKNQIEKIQALTDRDYTRDEVLLPALKKAHERRLITDQEHQILMYLVKSEDMAIKSSELDRFGLKSSSEKSYVMKKLRESKMVAPTIENGRTYTIRFANSYLLRSVVQLLEEKGFVADFLNNAEMKS